MAASTGPVIAAGGVVVFNAVIIQQKPLLSQQRIIIGAVIAAMGLSLWENAMPRTAVAMSWLILASTLLVRVDPATPSPIESFQQWYRAK